MEMPLTLVAEVVDAGLTIGKTAADYPLEHYVRTNNNVAPKIYTMVTDDIIGELSLSPNPASGQTVVTCELSDNITEATVLISSMTGREVYTSNVTPASAEHTVDLRGLPSGLYVAQLTYHGQVFDAKQLVVE